eukprot:TRINITY_DN1681_c0_g2_i1.p7 TRINITY_DN1681_c0_g2~~TRINITY_DN1681_c0_g2_i1.p7  ORF type:complete len:128 (+),score=29.18 TRINITY_DN1681_c0_g2_i1:119-502(+)
MFGPGIFFFFLMIRRPPRSTHCISSAASDVYKRQGINAEYMGDNGQEFADLTHQNQSPAPIPRFTLHIPIHRLKKELTKDTTGQFADVYLREANLPNIRLMISHFELFEAELDIIYAAQIYILDFSY